MSDHEPKLTPTFRFAILHLQKNAAMVAEKENAGKIFCNTFETLISKALKEIWPKPKSSFHLLMFNQFVKGTMQFLFFQKRKAASKT